MLNLKKMNFIKT